MSASITVFIVDKDESVLRAMARLMKAVGFEAECFSSIEDLFHEDLASRRIVLLVDVSTARQFEASLHEQLIARGLAMPVIYLTDCDTDRMRRTLRSQGAAGYFRKPVVVNTYSIYTKDIKPKGFDVIELEGYVTWVISLGTSVAESVKDKGDDDPISDAERDALIDIEQRLRGG